MKLSRWIFAAFYVIAGLNHFRDPQPYLNIMPPSLPAPKFLVAFSGLCEILGGLGVLFAPTRRLSAWGVVAMLLAIYPANIYALQHGMKINGKDVPTWALWLRLPLQIPLIWWAVSIARDDTSK